MDRESPAFRALSGNVLRLEVGDLSGLVSIAEESGAVGPGGGEWDVSYSEGWYLLRWGGAALTRLRVRQLGEQKILLAHEVYEGERVYGLGERYSHGLDRRYRRFHVWNAPQPIQLPFGDPMYLSLPFYIVARPGKTYGVLVDHPGYAQVDVCLGDPGLLEYTVWSGGLKAYIIAGRGVHEVLDHYTRITGRPFLPPKWAIGYHQSRYSYMSESEVLEVAGKFRELGIPCDAIYLDIDYMDGYRVFTWDRRRFPDPAGLAERLRRMGFRLVTIIDVGVKYEKGYWAYDRGASRGVFLRDRKGSLFRGGVWPGLCVFPDFLNEEGRRYWAELVRGHLDLGVDGVWLDMNEPDIFYVEGSLVKLVGDLSRLVKEGRIREAGERLFWGGLYEVWTGGYKERGYSRIDAVHRLDSGGLADHFEVHNVYPLLQARATLEGFMLHDPNKRWFILSRSGYAGIQRYAAVWTGDNSSDWGHMAASIQMVLSLGLGGVVFSGADVGGFFDDADPELLVRWSQLGAFYPFYRNHSSKGTRRQEPWAFGEPYTSYIREAIRLRYRLLPYIYARFLESHRTGKPIARPLFAEFPEDPESYEVSDQFMLGDSILVAPVTVPGARSRSVYLPGKAWLDYWAPRLAGPGWTGVEAPLDRIPVFLREDGVLVEAENPSSAYDLGETLVVRSFLGERASTTVYDDDGETMEYLRGAFYEARVALRLEEGLVSCEWAVLNGSYKPWFTWVRLAIYTREKPRGLVVNGEPADFSLKPLGNLYLLTSLIPIGRVAGYGRRP